MARKRKAVSAGSTRSSKRLASATNAADPSSKSTGNLASAMSTKNSKPKRNPKRAARSKWEEENLMTSDKSPLIDMDLTKLLAQPDAWNCLEESEKQEILDLLPDGTHPNPYPEPQSAADGSESEFKIPPLPESFLRYSMNWRDAIRRFQTDLQLGKYDPVWQREAEKAMEERAAGKFDKFKEEQFEQFWGQKQKMDRTLAAGQSSQVKLKTLIEEGLVREGDVWKYSRAFSRGRNKWLVEKEAKIVAIDGPRLTFSIPSGTRVFLPLVPSPQPQSPVKPEATGPGESMAPQPPQNDITEPTEQESGKVTDAASEANTSRKRKSEAEAETAKRRRSESPTKAAVADEAADQNGQKPTPPANSPEKASTSIDEVIIPDVQGLTTLTQRILQEDGRAQNISNGNAWKDLRAYRNNQDMGSLWEIRQAWFLKKMH